MTHRYENVPCSGLVKPYYLVFYLYNNEFYDVYKILTLIIINVKSVLTDCYV